MTYVEPIAAADATDAADAQVVESIFGTSMALTEADLYAMQGIEDMQSWLAELDQVKADRAQEAGKSAGEYVSRVLDDLGEAVRDGELGIHDAATALSWSIQRLGIQGVMAAVAGTGGLVATFALFDRAHHYDRAARRHPPKRAGASSGAAVSGTTSTTAPHAGASGATSTHKAPSGHPGHPKPHSSPRAPLSTPGGPTVPTRTPGERMVRAAEEKVTSRHVEVPGFARAEADAITAALAITYADLAGIVAGVADELLRQIDAHARVIVRTIHETRTIRRTVEPRAPVSQSEYDNLLKRVERLQKDLQHTTTEVQRLQRMHPATTGTGPNHPPVPTPTTPPSYTREIQAIRRVQVNHGQAIHDIFGKLGPLVLLAPVVPTLRQMTPQTLAKLQRTATEVETCVVTECAGPHDLQSALRRLLPKLLADAAMVGFVQQAIADPQRTANATNDVSEPLLAPVYAALHAILGTPDV